MRWQWTWRLLSAAVIQNRPTILIRRRSPHKRSSADHDRRHAWISRRRARPVAPVDRRRCYAMLRAMKVYVFQSGKQPDLVGFTVDATGANLPPDLAPWTAWTPSEAEAAIETEPDTG